MVLAVEDVADDLAALGDGVGGEIAQWDLLLELLAV
ncbi:hypothetical protein Q3H58_001437 [Pseudomonas psychrotolerans]|nr:hypothetical protein [Pseudomonas psychrotolerans]